METDSTTSCKRSEFKEETFGVVKLRFPAHTMQFIKQNPNMHTNVQPEGTVSYAHYKVCCNCHSFIVFNFSLRWYCCTWKCSFVLCFVSQKFPQNSTNVGLVQQTMPNLGQRNVPIFFSPLLSIRFFIQSESCVVWLLTTPVTEHLEGLMMMIIIIIIIIIIVIIILIITLRGAIWNFSWSPHCARNCLHTCTLKWPGSNHVQIMWNILSAHHVQHIICHVGQLSY